METMDDFREELEASFKKIRVGDVVTGTVIDVTEDQVIVDLKTYADGVIRKEDPRIRILICRKRSIPEMRSPQL